MRDPKGSNEAGYSNNNGSQRPENSTYFEYTSGNEEMLFLVNIKVLVDTNCGQILVFG